MATKLKVRIYGDPCLRVSCETIDKVGPAERMLIQSMFSTMESHKGIGLAAPQVGVTKRLFVIDVGKDYDGPKVFINPKIIKTDGLSVMEEGCLSIPKVNIDVKRPHDIVVRFQNEYDELMEMEAGDLLARVIQHENDHLNGKMIVDYMTKGQKVKAQSQLQSLEALYKGKKSG